MATLKRAVINQWIDDLLDPYFNIKYNSDYFCTTVGRKKKLMGDAALFLAYRQADVQSDAELFEWINKLKIPAGGYDQSEYIVSLFTNIPLEDACKFMWPKVLWNAAPDYEPTAADFVKVLRHYLKTKEVDWGVAVPLPPPEGVIEEIIKPKRRAKRKVAA